MKKNINGKQLVSVVILRYKKLKDTLKSISSIKKQTYTNFEIIVVDDASPDDSYEEIIEKHPDIDVIRLKKSLGRVAHNKGLKKAKGDILIPLDADMYLPANFIENVVAKFSKFPEINFIAPNLIHPENKAFQWRPVYDKEPTVEGGYECAGGLPVMKKRGFNKVGGFNPDIFLYVDEWEHLIRIWKAGFKVIYFPDLIAYHTYSANPYRSIMMGYHTVVNYLQLYALYLPLRVWPKFLFHHTSEFSEVLTTGKANRIGTIKGLIWGIYFFLKALKKRRVLDEVTLNTFMKYYFPKRGEIVVEKWGWVR